MRGLTILATSRRSLGVPGEQVWRVAGLAVPAPDRPGGDEGAVELFAERARRADPGFSLEGSRAAVIRICRRLDGIPLAIELAAARVTVLTPDQIAERLRRDSRLLSQGPSTAPARHRTLTATLDWSHRMLDAHEQAVFRRLSAFRGSFSLTACEAVAAGGEVDAGDVLDILGRLVDRSLVHVAGGPGDTRYRLLETVRQYAADKLREAGERDAPSRRTRRSSSRWPPSARPTRWPGWTAWSSSTTTCARRCGGCWRSPPSTAAGSPGCCGRSGTAAGTTPRRGCGSSRPPPSPIA